MTFEEVIKDPDFIVLPIQEKRKVLVSIDSDYANLPEKEQTKVLTSLPKKVYLDIGYYDKEPKTQEEPIPKWAEDNPNLYGLYGAGKTLYEQVGKPAIETGGLIAGGILSSGASPLAIPLGAGLGYASSKRITNFLDTLVGTKKPETIPESFMESAKDIGTGAMFEMGGQATGKIISKGIEKVLAPHATKMTEQAKYVQSLAKEYGFELSPAEVTGSKNLALFESLLEKTPFSSDTISQWRELKQLKPLLKLRERTLSRGNIVDSTRLGNEIKEQANSFLSKFKIQREDTLNAMRDNLLKNLGSSESYEDLGKTTKEILTNRSTAVVANKNILYREVGKAIPKEKIEINNLTSIAQKNLEEINKLPYQDTKLRSILKWASGETDPEMQQTLKMISEYPEEVQKQILDKTGILGKPAQDWTTLQNFRNMLNDAIKGEDLSIKMNNPDLKGQITNEGRIYKELKKALDKDFQTMAENTGSDAVKRLKIANAFYKEEFAPIWKQKTIQKLAYSDPEKVIDVLYKPNTITEISLAKKALGEEGFSKTLKPAFTNKLLSVGKEEVFNPRKLLTNLSKIGDQTLNSIYSTDELKALKDLAMNGRLLLETKLPGGNFIKGIAENYPDIIVDSILGSSKTYPNPVNIMKNINIIKNTIDNPTFEKLRYSMAEKIFSLHPLTGQVRPETFSRVVSNYEKVLPLFYKPEEISWLNNVSTVTKKMVSAERLAQNPSGTAQNIIAWGTFGAILRNPIKGTLFALSPKAAAKLYLSPTGRRYFTEGLIRHNNMAKNISLFTKISSIVGNENLTPIER